MPEIILGRIAIIGCAGGGKSTLARRLAERLTLPLVHLDVLYWKPGWVEGDEAEFRARLSEALASGRWITDGNFASEGDLHLANAELIVWVDQPRLLCLWRSIWRVIATGRRRRGDLPEGCPETFDPWLWDYIWHWNRRTRPKIEAALAEHAPNTPLVRLRSDREIANWLTRQTPPETAGSVRSTPWSDGRSRPPPPHPDDR